MLSHDPRRAQRVFVLCEHGRVRAAFAHRRLREKPPSGGVSVLSESTLPDPVAVEYADRLLRSLKWRGVAMVTKDVADRELERVRGLIAQAFTRDDVERACADVHSAILAWAAVPGGGTMTVEWKLRGKVPGRRGAG